MENSGICAKCQEEITDSRCLIVGEKKFHEDHFTCTLCSALLGQQPYNVDETQTNYYCNLCYINEIAPKCAACGNGIGDNVVELSQGIQLHKECFICFRCKKQLESQYIQDEDEHVICYECQESAADKCSSCGQAILDVKITVDSKTFHNNCFKCDICTEVISEEQHDYQEGRFVHRRCLNLICSFCQNQIISDYGRNQEQLYHIDCWDLMKQQNLNEQNTDQQEESKQLDSFSGDIQQEIKKEEQTIENEVDTQNQEKVALRIQEEEALRHKQEEDRRISEEEEEKKSQDARNEEKKKLLEYRMERIKEAMENSEKQQALELKIKMEKSRVEKEKALKEQEAQKKEEPKPVSENNNQVKAVYKVIPYDTLLTNPPADIDFTKKEQYLSDQEFEKLFGMQKSEFSTLKAWRQKELKQKFKLF